MNDGAETWISESQAKENVWRYKRLSFPHSLKTIRGWHVSHKLCIQSYVLPYRDGTIGNIQCFENKKGYAPGICLFPAPSCSLKDSTEPVFIMFQDQTIRMHIAKVGSMCSHESSPQSFHQITISTGWTIVFLLSGKIWIWRSTIRIWGQYTGDRR